MLQTWLQDLNVKVVCDDCLIFGGSRLHQGSFVKVFQQLSDGISDESPLFLEPQDPPL